MKTVLMITLLASVNAFAGRPGLPSASVSSPAITIHCTDKAGVDTAIGTAVPRPAPVLPEIAGWFPYEITFALLGGESGAKVYADFSGVNTSPMKFSNIDDFQGMAIETVAISNGTVLNTPNQVFDQKLGTCQLTPQ